MPEPEKRGDKFTWTYVLWLLPWLAPIWLYWLLPTWDWWTISLIIWVLTLIDDIAYGITAPGVSAPVNTSNLDSQAPRILVVEKDGCSGWFRVHCVQLWRKSCCRDCRESYRPKDLLRTIAAAADLRPQGHRSVAGDIMTSAVNAIKQLNSQQARKEMVSRPGVGDQQRTPRSRTGAGNWRRQRR